MENSRLLAKFRFLPPWTKILLPLALAAAAAAIFALASGDPYDQKMRAVLEGGPPSGFGQGSALVVYDEDSRRYTDLYIP